MKTLVIYDTTGRIWSIIYGEESAPQGVPYLFTDIPEGATIERVDVTDPKNPKVVFTYSESSEEQEEMKTAMMFLADTFTKMWRKAPAFRHGDISRPCSPTFSCVRCLLVV